MRSTYDNKTINYQFLYTIQRPKGGEKCPILESHCLSFSFEYNYGFANLFSSFQVLNNIQLDGQKIATRIPDFTIQNGQLQTEEKEGFIYQTNSIIFTFDPEGKRTEQDISTDLMGNFVSVGMLKNKLIIALPNTGTTSALLNNNQLELPYTNESLKNLTGKQLRSF